MVNQYIHIRNDDKSISIAERELVRQCAQTNLRTDGRTRSQQRDLRLDLSQWFHGSACTVQWGSRVTASCTADLVPPHPDRPSEGVVAVSVDLSPGASSSFRQAPPVSTTGGASGGSGPLEEDQKLWSNRILRILEKLLAEALDAEALCVSPQAWVWKLHVSVTVLDYGGNMVDSCVMAAIGALRHYRMPHVDLEGPRLVPYELQEPTPLPLHHTPLSLTIALITPDDDSDGNSISKVALLVDPSLQEEMVAAGFVTIAMNVHEEVCLLDFGGGTDLPTSELRECWKATLPIIPDLCLSLEKSLKEASDKAMEERLAKIKQSTETSLPPAPSVPFYEASNDMDVDLQDVSKEVQSAIEEAYRKQALDYNLGHITKSIREDEAPKVKQALSSQFLTALLGSVPSETQKCDHQARASSGVSVLEEPTHEPNVPRSATTGTVPDPSRVPTHSGILDSDTEEATTQLANEFALPTEVDDDVDDLAAAIKSKKKKKSKSKK